VNSQSAENSVVRLSAATTRNRAALIRSAQHVLAEIGPDATVEQFVAHAEVSPTTIYNHFGSKEAMFSQALAQIFREWLRVGSWRCSGRRKPRHHDRCMSKVVPSPTNASIARPNPRQDARRPELRHRSLNSRFVAGYRRCGPSRAGQHGRIRQENPHVRLLCCGHFARRLHYTGTLPRGRRSFSRNRACNLGLSPEAARAITSRPLDI